MSATKRPKRSDLLRLIDVMNRCEYPLLIHCKSGADRTGLATTIYRMVVLKEPPEKALAAFTIYHSHVPIFGPERLHEPIDEYAAWLTNHGLPHTPERFRNWVLNTYESDDPSVEPPPVAPDLDTRCEMMGRASGLVDATGTGSDRTRLAPVPLPPAVGLGHS